MKKCGREAADNFETEALPQADGARVGADDKVELHGAKAAIPGVIERMHAHGAGYAATGSGRSGHVAAVGDVGTAAILIGAEEIGADDAAVVEGDKDFVGGREPKRESGVVSDVARQSVGFAGAKDGFENGPDGVGVGGESGPDNEHGYLEVSRRRTTSDSMWPRATRNFLVSGDQPKP